MTITTKELKDNLWVFAIAFTIVVLIMGLHINNNNKNIKELQNRTDTMKNTLHEEIPKNFEWKCVEQAVVKVIERKPTGDTAGEFCYEMMGCEYTLVDYMGKDVEFLESDCYERCIEKYGRLWKRDTAVFIRNETICLKERLVLKNITRLTSKAIDSTDWELVK